VMSPSLVATVWAMSMLQRRRAGQQEAADETLDRRIAEVQREREIEEQLEFVDWSSGRLLNLGDAVNMKQGLKDLKLVDLFFKVMAQPPGILLTSPHPQQLELELHGPESPLVGSMFTTCQPGVGERTSLLRGITDVKVAFRLATMRQQLDVDRAPKLDAVKDWAEYILAELEELSKAQSVAKLAQPHSSASNQMPPVVGPSVKALVSQWEGKESAKKREPEAAKEKAAVGEAKEEQNQQKPIESRIQADGESGIEVALLDGGATHALRQAKPSELSDLRPVEVEMAVGKVCEAGVHLPTGVPSDGSG
ncbi:unnamed protein product, partial [Cladocopium goreaui]